MSNVEQFPGLTTLDIDPDTMLCEAVGRMSEVVIVGFDKDGLEFFASSKADAGDIMFHLQRAMWTLNQTLDESCR